MDIKPPPIADEIQPTFSEHKTYNYKKGGVNLGFALTLGRLRDYEDFYECLVAAAKDVLNDRDAITKK